MGRGCVRGVACVLFVLILLAGGCGTDESKKSDAETKTIPADHKVSAEKRIWEDILQKAHGTTVTFYMYGGMANVNRWIDGYVAETVKKRFDITLERVPMDAAVFVNKLLTEKAAGRDKGSIDLLWINGENFRNARKADLLYGPVTAMLPNFNAYADKMESATDFGFPVNGYEAPYGRAQFVMEYDQARTPEPPMNIAALREWVMAHPGRFTYPQPPDFTGSAFVRQIFYAVTGGYKQYMNGFDQALYDAKAPLLWQYLNDIEPYLWQKGQTYPKDPGALELLFTRGEVDLMMAYHPTHAQSQILDGTYPSSVRTFVMRDGSIYNTHFTAIPANAPNVYGAMVVMDFLMSPDAQLSKFEPENWGDFPAISLTHLSPEQAKRFTGVDLGVATLSPDVLRSVAVPEIPSEWLEALEQGWQEHILHK